MFSGLCSVALHHGAVGWSAVCEFLAIFTYFLIISQILKLTVPYLEYRQGRHSDFVLYFSFSYGRNHLK